MSSEIVPAEPIQEITEEEEEERVEQNQNPSTSFTRSITYGEHNHLPEPFDSETVPVNLRPHIQSFLRIANEIEIEEPRVAYLCRFHAFEKAHVMDKHSTGRGVRQFKTKLLQRLQQDTDRTVAKRKERSDIRELKRVCNGYLDYINRHIGRQDFTYSEKLINARKIASVLYEVLNTVRSEAGHQALADRDSNDGQSELYMSYNILPLGAGGVHQPIMRLPEIKVAVAAVHNIRGLPFLEDFKKRRSSLDLFDWLEFCFGFQTGNVANQREHLILLLANTHIRHCHKQTVLQLPDRALDGLMRKFFKNYTIWCKYLGRKSNIRLPYVKQEAQQYKVLYIGLYLLIWGEAANLRFMPECLCYIYHHMAYELHSMLTGAVSLMTWERVMPAYGGEPESFLSNVVTPIYRVIYEEAEKNRNGTADHSTWRNYDDLNEFFWSPSCFEIGWPMHLDHEFFHVKSPDDQRATNCWIFWGKSKEKRGVNSDEEQGDTINERSQPKWLGKTNFVEIRSFLQIFRSFDRMWNFLILALQALTIIACHDLKSPLELLETQILEDIMSIFITSAGLKLIHAVLDIAFTWKARRTMDSHQFLKYIFKLVIAVIWIIILPVLYAETRRKYTCYHSRSGSWLDEWCYSSYMVAVGIYLMSNAVDMILFFVPAVARYIETSNYRICTILTWWTQPRLYVGCGMQEDQVSIFKYMLFWLLLLLSKLSFSYYFEIKPLIEPTRQILRRGIKRYEWHELFPEVKSNAGTVVAVWAPIILVYFMDTQIWYSVFCTIFGGLYGILHHLGEIRTLGTLRSRFQTLPKAFNACLIPPSLRKDKDRVRKGVFDRLRKASGNGKKDVNKFVTVWNQIVHSFRQEDLISNRERDLMLIPLSSEIFSDRVRWPVFLLASKFSTALSIANFVVRDEDLFRKIRKDGLMNCAVKECYDTLKYILEVLVVGELEKSIIFGILSEIEESFQRSSLLEDIRMSELPALQAKCIQLAEILVERIDRPKLDGPSSSNLTEQEIELQRNKQEIELHRSKVVKVLEDIFELVTNDMMINGSRTLDMLHSSQDDVEDLPFFSGHVQPQLFASKDSIHFNVQIKKDSIHFRLTDSDAVLEQINRFLLLLTVKDKAMDIPSNIEAKRRLSFFTTSLFMNMPDAPEVRSMLSFSVLTPHYVEEVKFSMAELQSSRSHVSILFYMQKIYPDEWRNFLERVESEDLCTLLSKTKDEKLREDLFALLSKHKEEKLREDLDALLSKNKEEKLWEDLDALSSKKKEEKLREDLYELLSKIKEGKLLDELDALLSKIKEEKLRDWTSFRGQTLSRTVRGMMYYREALKLQAFLDTAEDEEIIRGYDAIGRDRSAQLDALVDMKFTYVVSWQKFGELKTVRDPRAVDILELMTRYPAMRVAYVEEREETVADRPRTVHNDLKKRTQTVYSSVLVKGHNNLDQEIYRIKLPGPPNIGEGKPENQNHSIIFTRGEALQTIDMNQDNYLEEAFKIRNVLQEFLEARGPHAPTIVGLREHVFTGSVSSLAWFMSYQETSFVTIGQRLLANPLRVRFHYGHPDLFDRVFHITRGGVSKASKTINLSEDVFAGFNSILRRGHVTYHEYMQVGKGRDVGLNQISKFEAKVANGNSEQTLSRDIYRLGRRFDFFRMLSCYFTTIGFYFSSLMSVLSIYIFLYGQLYLVLSGVQKELLKEARSFNIKSLETALASQSFIQLGLLTGLPMVMEIALERGFLTALKDFVLMQLQLAAVFFTFSFGTKSHYYGRTILHGGAKYRHTGRRVVIFHASFTENYRLYSRSHFVKGFELQLLLIVYDIFRRSYESNTAYVLITYAIWFMSMTWLFAPCLFNPSGFNFERIIDDWKDWNKWIKHYGGIGIHQEKSWHSWWDDEQAHLRRAGLTSRLIEILLSLRFFMYQYGLVYHLDISQRSKTFVVYMLSWVVIVVIFTIVKVVNVGRQWLSANHQFVFRIFKAIILVAVMSTVITLSVICDLSLMDLIVCCLAFLPTGWGLILIAQAIRPLMESIGLWNFIRVFARAYDYGMGAILFTPIASLAWLPIIQAFQTRFLFNQAYSRRLQIQPILSGKKKNT